MWICPMQYSKLLKQKKKREFLCVSFGEKRKIRQYRQPQGRERQTESATGYYPMKCSRQAASRLSIFLKSGLPFENISSLPPCNKQGLSTRIFSYNTPPLCSVYYFANSLLNPCTAIDKKIRKYLWNQRFQMIEFQKGFTWKWSLIHRNETISGVIRDP